MKNLLLVHKSARMVRWASLGIAFLGVNSFALDIKLFDRHRTPPPPPPAGRQITVVRNTGDRTFYETYTEDQNGVRSLRGVEEVIKKRDDSAVIKKRDDSTRMRQQPEGLDLQNRQAPAPPVVRRDSPENGEVVISQTDASSPRSAPSDTKKPLKKSTYDEGRWLQNGSAAYSSISISPRGDNVLTSQPEKPRTRSSSPGTKRVEDQPSQPAASPEANRKLAPLPNEPAVGEKSASSTGVKTLGNKKPEKEFPPAIKTDSPNRVKSPYPPYRDLDVTGLPTGSLAKDPSTGEIFRMP